MTTHSISFDSPTMKPSKSNEMIFVADESENNTGNGSQRSTPRKSPHVGMEEGRRKYEMVDTSDARSNLRLDIPSDCNSNSNSNSNNNSNSNSNSNNNSNNGKNDMNINININDTTLGSIRDVAHYPSKPLTFQQRSLQIWHAGLKHLIAWIMWLLIGTFYFGTEEFDSDYCRGFYYSVNVGYSVGWGVLSVKKDSTKIFSIFYLLVGSISVGFWLARLVENVHVKLSEWEPHLERIRQLQLHERGLHGVVSGFCDEFLPMIQSVYYIIVWILYIVFGTIWSMNIYGWSVVDGLYFSVSSLSTAGLLGIPIDAPSWEFCFIGLFASTGNAT